MALKNTVRAAAVSVLLALGALLAAVPAMADSADAPPPVFPSGSAEPEEDEGLVRLPGVIEQRGNFWLAVSESAQHDINSVKLMDGVAEAMGRTDAKILLAIDHEPVTVSGAAQLVRGMLLFGPTDALADDWLEHGKDRGYVNDGWIVIGVVLPEGQGAVEVALDRGRNVREASDEAVEAVLQAGRDEWNTGNHTEAAIATVIQASIELPVSPNYGFWALGGAGVAATAVAGILLVRTARHRSLKSAAERRRKADSEITSILRLSTSQNDWIRPWPATGSTGPTAAAIEFLDRQLPQVAAEGNAMANALREPVPVSTAQLKSLQRQRSVLQGAGEANGQLGDLVGKNLHARRAWIQLISRHRSLLAANVRLLESPGASRLENAAELRALNISHTDALDSIASTVKDGLGEGASVETFLDRLWDVRRELDEGFRRAVQGGIRIPDDLGAQLRLFGEAHEDPDVIERLEWLQATVDTQAVVH